MAVKDLAFEAEARASLLAGVEKLARAVKATLGPRGRNAVIDKSWGGPSVTKDGVTVAEEVEFSDKNENMGAKLVKEAASKTSKIAGDGTTTATVLTEALFKEAFKNLAAGADGMALKRGMEAGAKAATDIATVPNPTSLCPFLAGMRVITDAILAVWFRRLVDRVLTGNQRCSHRATPLGTGIRLRFGSPARRAPEKRCCCACWPNEPPGSPPRSTSPMRI